jgi:hypothetical protein
MMVVRTKSIGVRLRIPLWDKIEGYMADNDLILTEALTAILERGLSAIEADNGETSNYQLQLDKLIIEVAALRKTVDKLSAKPVLKKKSHPVIEVADWEPNDRTDDDEFSQHVAAVVAKSKKISPHIDLVDGDEDDYEVADRGLTDEEIESISGFNLGTILENKQRCQSSGDELRIAGCRYDRSSELWHKT